MTPLEATKQGYSLLSQDLNGTGYNLFIHQRALYFLNVAIQDDYASHNLMKKIIEMRSNPRPWDGGIKKGTTDHRQIAVDGVWVNYFIHSGFVYINSIELNPRASKKHELAGLHLVTRDKFNKNSWTITQGYLDDIKTEHAAVNGQNNSRLEAASTVMPRHLADAYKKDEITEFTLFHNPTQGILGDTYESARDKLGFTTAMTRKFAELLNKTQQKHHSVKWVAHSQGGVIFSQAVNVHNKTVGTSLDKHTVYFQASANNMLVTKRILKKARVNLHNDGYNNSPIDGVPQVIGLNAVTDVVNKPGINSLARLTLAPIALIPGLLPLAFLSANFSTHATPYEGLGKYGTKVAQSSSKLVINMIRRVV